MPSGDDLRVENVCSYVVINFIFCLRGVFSGNPEAEKVRFDGREGIF